MGNIFCGEAEEASKNSAFLVSEGKSYGRSHLDQPDSAGSAFPDHQHNSNQHSSTYGNGDGGMKEGPLDGNYENDGMNNTTAAISSSEAEQRVWKDLVQATARTMVPIRTARDNYYDQGFAAALSRYLEQTTAFHDHVPIGLPPAPITTTSIPALLTAPPTVTSRIQERQMDELAEQWIDTLLPKNERMFANVGPILENLL